MYELKARSRGFSNRRLVGILAFRNVLAEAIRNRIEKIKVNSQ